MVKGLCSRASLIIFDGLSKERCIAAHLFGKQLLRLVKKSGFLFAALYLKQCSTSLQMAYGSGIKHQPTQLPVPVALTRTGYPVIIPSYHRKMIRKRDEKADRLVQLYLSFFSFSKVIIAAKRLSKETFKSIVTPLDSSAIVGVISPIKEKLLELTNRYLPRLGRIPIHQGIRWMPTWKSLPSDRLMKESLRKGVKLNPKCANVLGTSSVFTSLFWELAAYTHLLNAEHAFGEQFRSGVLWYKFTRYALDPANTYWVNYHLDKFEKEIGPFLPNPHAMGIPFTCGKLGMSLEGGGKRRIFAIGLT